MKKAWIALLIAAPVLVLIGVVTFLLQPGPPEGECAEDPSVTSGFVDQEKNCPLSIESWEEIADWNSSPKPFRIAGLLFGLAGVAAGGLGVLFLLLDVYRRRSADPGPPSSA